MTARAERRIFWGAAFGLWAVFFVQALHVPTLLDDWYQLTWHRHHAFGLHSIWVYAHYNYFHFNPRIGDGRCMMVNGPRAIHLVLTPLVHLALLPFAFAVIFTTVPSSYSAEPAHSASPVMYVRLRSRRRAFASACASSRDQIG